MNIAEYIWLDGSEPIPQIRSKTRVVQVGNSHPGASDFPEWSFDGSSTAQADGSDSDCILIPVSVVRDPIRGGENYLVLCEVQDADGNVHPSNTRSKLRQVAAKSGDQDPWIGFEQEYTLFKDGRPLGWPTTGFPGPQGPYYCSVGAEVAFGREIAERHMQACTSIGLSFYGLNAEVMPGQWEFQIGYRGFDAKDPSVLDVADQLWIARWLLHRIAEDEGVSVSFDNKPVAGDWNGAGMHTNFSTRQTRDKSSGLVAIQDAVNKLKAKHDEHIAVYGFDLEKRLTGDHETCSIDEFKSGAADRGASIRIPRPVASKGYGYFEDRRPGANADPYLVAARLIETVCVAKEERPKGKAPDPAIAA